MMWFYAFMVAAAMCALNVALYVTSGSPVSLGAAIFCGALAIFDMVQAARD